MRTAYALLGLAFLIVFGLAFVLYKQSERSTLEFSEQRFSLTPAAASIY